MAVRKFKPMTPGTRHKVIGTFDDITSSTPEKSLLSPLKSSGGRNNSGKMTVRYIGGGHKRMYRIVDFKRDKDNMSAQVYPELSALLTDIGTEAAEMALQIEA